MKYIWASILSIAVMVGLCIGSSCRVIRSIEVTMDLLEEAIDKKEHGHDHAVLDTIDKAEKSWTEQEVFFGTVLRHDEIDDVIEEFARLRSYAASEDQDDFLSNCKALIARLEHICSMEKPSFENIM